MSRAQHPGPVTTHKTHWTSHSQLVHIIVHFPTLVCVEGDSAALMERQQGDQNFNNILLVFFFISLLHQAGFTLDIQRPLRAAHCHHRIFQQSYCRRCTSVHALNSQAPTQSSDTDTQTGRANPSVISGRHFPINLCVMSLM